MEQTFVMIKPWSMKNAVQLLRILEGAGRRTHAGLVDTLPRAIIEAHYAVHRGRPFFEYMINAFVEEAVALGVYEGKDVIQRTRTLVGPTDPAIAPDDTLRGLFSNDSKKQAIAQGRPLENVIHCSDSEESAHHEISVWSDYLHKM